MVYLQLLGFQLQLFSSIWRTIVNRVINPYASQVEFNSMIWTAFHASQINDFQKIWINS